MSSNYIPQDLTPLQEARLQSVKAIETGNGGYTNKALRSLGIETPPKSGWLRRYVLNGPDFEPLPEPPKAEQLPLL